MTNKQTSTNDKKNDAALINTANVLKGDGVALPNVLHPLLRLHMNILHSIRMNRRIGVDIIFPTYSVITCY